MNKEELKCWAGSARAQELDIVVHAYIVAVPALKRQTDAEGSRVQGQSELYSRPCIHKRNQGLENRSESCEPASPQLGTEVGSQMTGDR